MKTMLTTVVLIAASLATSARANGQEILEFTLKGCPPCSKIAPEIQRLKTTGLPVRVIHFEQDDRHEVERFGVSSFPTIVLVDSTGKELDRRGGYQTAGEISRWFAQKTVAPIDARPWGNGSNPNPRETSVRVRVVTKGSIGYGSGTIVLSSDAESIVLTCGHILRKEGSGKAIQLPQIKVDLDDEAVDAREIGHDFNTDLALLRIHPGRKLPYSRVVPLDWKPTRGMTAIAVGFPYGKQKAAFITTVKRVGAHGPATSWRGIIADRSPEQGRSGGGLFTDDGFLMAVCDFASPTVNEGMYSGPERVHEILDHASLAVVYTGVAAPAAPEAAAPEIASPEPAEPASGDESDDRFVQRLKRFLPRCHPTPQQGPPGLQGPQGQRGAAGPAGPAGPPGQNATPVDVAALLLKIEALEQAVATLQQHDATPMKVAIIREDGSTTAEPVYPDWAPGPNPKPHPDDGPFRARIGIKLTKSQTQPAATRKVNTSGN